MRFKTYITNGTEVKTFDTRAEALKFLKTHVDWWEVMA